MTGRSQALNTWLKEFIYNILIQPFHCIIYLVFSNILATLLESNGSDTNPFVGISLGGGVIAIIIMLFIKQSEGIIRVIFGFGNAKSLGDSFAAGALLVGSMKTAGSALGNIKQAHSKSQNGGQSSGSTSSSSARKPNLKDTSNVGSGGGSSSSSSSSNTGQSRSNSSSSSGSSSGSNASASQSSSAASRSQDNSGSSNSSEKEANSQSTSERTDNRKRTREY